MLVTKSVVRCPVSLIPTFTCRGPYQLRGSVSNASPLVDYDGNALAFNGEVFEGLGEMSHSQNDARALLSTLAEAIRENALECDPVAMVLSELKGLGPLFSGKRMLVGSGLLATWLEGEAFLYTVPNVAILDSFYPR